MLKTDTIENTLSEYYLGNLSAEDAQAVEAWIRSDVAHQEIADEVFLIEQISKNIAATDGVEQALERNGKMLRNRKCKRVWTRGMRAAAAVVVVLLALSNFYVIRSFKSSEVSSVEIRTITGMVSTSTLPDGTQVWLNSNSKLEYPSSFNGKDRVVTLDGEAFFKVAKDGRKFSVLANGVTVDVLGTEFDVEAYSGNTAEVRTTLLTGKVRMSYKDFAGNVHGLTMNPGECYLYNADKESIESVPVSPISAVAWKDGRIILDRTSLEDALRMIGNRFNVRFVIRNEKLLSNMYTGSFTDQRLDVILNYFKKTTDMNFDFVSTESGPDNYSGRQVVLVY